MTAKTDTAMMPDSVMEEVHRVKAELSKRYNYDVAAMGRDARARQAHSGHKVMALEKRQAPDDSAA